jgi:carboxylesterase type B
MIKEIMNVATDAKCGYSYAAPVIGDRRFRAPEEPLKENGVVIAKEAGSLLN